MKNTGFVILCCILTLIIIPLLYTQQFEKQKEVRKISVYNVKEDNVMEMDLEEYVLKVLEKEMGIGYCDEALKAQAVAIRTYALRKASASIPEHKGADLCTDYNHCMAYNYEILPVADKYKRAVNSTKGLVLRYNNELAATFFFAISAGKTQNCKDVWWSDIPYLVSVNCSFDEERTGFSSEKSFESSEIEQLLSVDTSQKYSVNYLDSGYVKEVVWGDKKIKGEDVRKKLKLRSASFEIIKDGNNYVFKVKGYGHGVGMSQQGADALAKQGKTFEEILKYYYKGTYLSA
jgi:stage II sporulation protein D